MNVYSVPGSLPRKVHLQLDQRWIYGGMRWTVVTLSGPEIGLRGDAGDFMRIGPMELVEHGELADAPQRGATLGRVYSPSVVAPQAASRASARRLEIVQWLIEGHPPGSSDNVLSAFGPDVGTTARVRVIANETGIGASTVLRWLRHYRQAGVDGLVDRQRVPIHRPLGDCPREVAEVLYEVMSEQGTQSRHTDTFMIREIRARCEERYQDRVPQVSDRAMRRYLALHN